MRVGSEASYWGLEHYDCLEEEHSDKFLRKLGKVSSIKIEYYNSFYY